MDALTQFIDHMAKHGCQPSRSIDIKPIGKIIRFHINGDKQGSRNGRCALWIEPDGFGSGWFMNMKEGQKYTWHSKASRKFTDEERREWAKKREADKQKRDEEQDLEWKAAAEKASYIWSKAVKGRHGYLERKKISGAGTRVYKGALVVPAYKSGKLTSLQFIAENGEKRFLTGGDIQGAYGSIGKDLSTIYICEGYATAASVHEATGKASVWAFNAGNLLDVCKTVRRRYPDAEIVVCCDNDQWTEIGGKLVNVGIVKGKEAARSAQGRAVWHDFPNDDEQKRTDFNDLHVTEGVEAVKNSLSRCDRDEEGQGASPYSYDGLAATENDPLVPPSYFNDIPLPEPEYHSRELEAVDDWKSLVICDAKGNPIKTSLKNNILYLQHLPKYKGIFRYNEFSHEIMVTRCPVWENEDTFRVHTLNDVDISETASNLESVGMSPDRTRIHNAIEVVANKNSFHPAKDYFNALEWDGVKRLDKWLSYYLGAEDDEPDYLAFIGKKWLTAAVRRVFMPGCKFDHVLVMEGKQGKGKSTALKVLATFGTDIEMSYFTDAITIADIQTKDTIQKIQGSIIVELAELAGFNKKDDEEIKRWITLQHDDVRLPYARTTTRFNRQFVLSATTNSYDYLKDPTGNRRYWPVKTENIDLEALKADRQQLWAEAVTLFKSGLYVGPTDEEMMMAVVAQARRRSIDAWEEDVKRAIDNLGLKPDLKTEDIMREMGLSLRDRDYKAQRRIASIMQGIGYESQPRRFGNVVHRVWVKL